MKIGLIGINNSAQEEHFKAIRLASNHGLSAIFSHSDDILPISSNYNVKLFRSVNDLCDNVEAVYFANSLKPNYDFAINAIKKSCHLFIEDLSELPIEEVKHLYKVAFEARVKIQLKLTKIFTPEYLEIRDYLNEPKFIEMSQSFNRFLRHKDYFSELLNNLCFAHQNIQSGIKKTSILALPVDKNHFSIVSIRLEYDNGAVVNMKFNNISDEDESLVVFHEKDRIIQTDLKNHFAIKHKFIDGQITRREFNIPDEEAFSIEMINFINTCENLDLQNISESPPELKLIQVTNEMIDKMIQLSHPKH